MARAADEAGVAIVGGDTKVVEHGKADGLYITTAGVGVVDERLALGHTRVEVGDLVILSGPIGDHGITILLARGEVDLEADTRSVWPFVEALAAAVPDGARWMRDPTRGGVALALNELAREARLGVVLSEEAIPLRAEVRGACEILGLDPLHVANERPLLAVVARDAGRGGGGAGRDPVGARRRGRRHHRRGGGAAGARGPGAEQLRRHADGGHAGRRPAPADLLSRRPRPSHGGTEGGQAGSCTAGVEHAGDNPACATWHACPPGRSVRAGRGRRRRRVGG